ncbi:SDR family oxidoreductase [Fulvivirga sedimenti]|uniref:SDR family oxidoreductase n=1 Tax=Fulvivirga sedimenti TaxID=2879465 RepID=A0A9X1HV55_9BACT|nr:SDR family oxidoreductase [Fulvivirga sedimenti]MCA6078864.1 SDR family oxidoreductase [Fulvivirga sedimenti]
MRNLSGLTALVTGGSKGIGYGIAAAMLQQGMSVAITSRSALAAEEAASNLRKIGKGNIIGLKADVRDFEEVKAAVQKTVDAFGGLDVLIANAGVGKFGSIEDISVEDWHATIETNLTGVFYSIKASVDELKKSQGYFITISSLAGTNFFAGGSAYNASKFGLTGFTQAVMLDLRQSGVKVSTIMPGSVATYFNDHVPNDADSWKIQIEDIGELVIDLLAMNPRTLPSKIEVRPSMPPK